MTSKKRTVTANFCFLYYADYVLSLVVYLADIMPTTVYLFSFDGA